MEKRFLVSRGFELPKDEDTMKNNLWFSLWSRKQWPFDKLDIGDFIYWYETPSKKIVWKTCVDILEKFEYKTKGELAERLISCFGEVDFSQSYYVNAPEKGYCLAWKVKPILEVNIPKPPELSVPQLGWLQVDEETISELLSLEKQDYDLILDKFSSGDNIFNEIKEMNEKMAKYSPEKVESIVKRTLRRDTKLIRNLKSLYNFQCQFPGCGRKIKKQDGHFYIEVAHIKPVREGGKSVIGNLLVLCPNHHKELDYGDLKIIEQTEELVSGVLNGKEFEITFTGLKS